jgi:hypothetical protein
MTKKKTINLLEEIPTHVASEDEERDWWAVHPFSATLLATLPPINEDDWDDLQSLRRVHQSPKPREIS